MNTAKILAITQPLINKTNSTFPQYEPNEKMTAEEFIAYAARVSNPSNQMNTETAPKLLKYLIKNKHWSPFELVHIVMEINTTRDIARQILRHRSFSFQEFCVAEGTKITTLKNCGRSKKIAIEDLYKRYKSSQYWTQSDNLVRVYDENTKSFVSRKIKEVFDTGVKSCYLMTLDNGKTIECTDEHKILTLNGFKQLKSVDVSQDFVACNGVPVYQSYDWLKEAKHLSIISKTGLKGIAEMASAKPETIRKWLRKHKLSFTKKEVASYTPAWNKGLEGALQPMFNKTHSAETKNNISAAARSRGKKHNFYKTGKYTVDNVSWRKYVAMECGKMKSQLLKEQNYLCPITGKILDIRNSDIDHILPVCFRPDLAFIKENLRVIAKEAHKNKSILESLQSKQTVTYSKIVSIEYIGEKQTYDLEVDHESHNYIANGIVTHNSQRYADPTKELGFTQREARLQDSKNRQNSIDIEDDLEFKEEWKKKQLFIEETIRKNYEWAILNGIAKEQARAILPEGMTISRMYMSGNLRSFIHWIEVRTDISTQKEHRQIAESAKQEILHYFPSLSFE
jgi:thymidylate synthase (FAD)